jgi:hypothetical protein
MVFAGIGQAILEGGFEQFGDIFGDVAGLIPAASFKVSGCSCSP